MRYRVPLVVVTVRVVHLERLVAMALARTASIIINARIVGRLARIRLKVVALGSVQILKQILTIADSAAMFAPYTYQDGVPATLILSKKSVATVNVFRAKK